MFTGYISCFPALRFSISVRKITTTIEYQVTRVAELIAKIYTGIVMELYISYNTKYQVDAQKYGDFSHIDL